jgi:hypothetical protein
MMVCVNQLAPGMQVEEDVLSVNNTLLIAAGTQLTPRHLRVLKTWGLEAIRIKDEARPDDNSAPAPAVDPSMLERAQARVAERMKLVDTSHPGVALIRDLAVRRAARPLEASATARKDPQ